MSRSPAMTCWRRFRTQADASGLNVRRVLPAERVDPHFPADHPAAPARLRPGYRRAVLLGSGGRTFWDAFQSQAPGGRDAHPLDRYTVRMVEALAGTLREADAGLVTAYPFAHARQIVPFRGLTRGLPEQQMLPFGVALDARYGPWFAWRAVLLTTLELPPEGLDAVSQCAACPAPCVTACPAGAVHKAGFELAACTAFRIAAPTCRETCLSRLACPVAPDQRYGPAQMAFHYRASLASILVPRGVP
ncbi:MAG: hypothetical protein HY342_03560 [Candidatus Lambdaproteobacteria bacterium]|nr:hypothetical protein [Candidatus Lambdaproteobacteria bacterium]